MLKHLSYDFSFLRASPDSLESRIFQNQISTNKALFAPTFASALNEHFNKAKQGVILRNGLSIAGIIAEQGEIGCSM